MDLSGVSSVSVVPGAISLQNFFYSNIILTADAKLEKETSVVSLETTYTLPTGAELLQQFVGLNAEGNSITKPGDVWPKRYYSKQSVDVTVGGSGSSVTIAPGARFITLYLLWLTAEATIPGQINSLAGTYQIISDIAPAPILVANDEWQNVDVKTNK